MHNAVESPQQLLTIGQVADRIQCQSWRIRRLFDRGILPEPARIGTTRVVPESQVETIRKAAHEAGYIRTRQPMPA